MFLMFLSIMKLTEGATSLLSNHGAVILVIFGNFYAIFRSAFVFWTPAIIVVIVSNIQKNIYELFQSDNKLIISTVLLICLASMNAAVAL